MRLKDSLDIFRECLLKNNSALKNFVFIYDKQLYTWFSDLNLPMFKNVSVQIVDGCPIMIRRGII